MRSGSGFGKQSSKVIFPVFESGFVPFKITYHQVLEGQFPTDFDEVLVSVNAEHRDVRRPICVVFPRSILFKNKAMQSAALGVYVEAQKALAPSELVVVLPDL